MISLTLLLPARMNASTILYIVVLQRHDRDMGICVCVGSASKQPIFFNHWVIWVGILCWASSSTYCRTGVKNNVNIWEMPVIIVIWQCHCNLSGVTCFNDGLPCSLWVRGSGEAGNVVVIWHYGIVMLWNWKFRYTLEVCKSAITLCQ